MSNRRNALGRGLGALIPGAGSQQASSRSRADADRPPAHSIVGEPRQTPQNGDTARSRDFTAPTLLRVSEIDPNPEQPRRVFDEPQLEELSQSIKRHGVLQPVVVRRSGDRYELIVGERRWRATQVAGLKTIPAVVADIEPQARLEIAIIENVQREDLNAIELAYAYRTLIENGATQEEVGRKVSKDRSSVANHLRLLDLSKEIQQDIEQGRLSMGHAKALLQISNPERRRHLRDRVVKEQLSVREAELLGRGIAGPVARKAPRKPRKSSTVLDPSLAPILEILQRHLQTRVRIVGGAERGTIEIEYFEKDDLTRIVNLLMEGAS
ncbi:MAG: ParB/RepB/Spo0J family partition protein [Deltaproteobacteria bacterium]|nr:ParB/RepB/Spo0J family partition protein [Deltaproteobacteria bacterium]